MCKRLTCFVPHLFPCSWQFTLTKHRHSDIHTPGLWLKDKKGVDENVGCVWLKFGGWLKGKLQQTETLSESQLDTFLPEIDVCDWKDIQLRSTTTCSCHGVFTAVQTSTEPDLLLLMYWSEFLLIQEESPRLWNMTGFLFLDWHTANFLVTWRLKTALLCNSLAVLVASCIKPKKKFLWSFYMFL